jgi:hypothetical protein
MDPVREWLNGNREYSSGVKLYMLFGNDPAIKRMFSEPESIFKKKKLSLALEAIWEGTKQPIPPVSLKPKTNPSPEPVPFKIKRELVTTKKEVKKLTGELVETQADLQDATNELEGVKEELEDLEWAKANLEEEKEELQEKLRKIKTRGGWPVDPDETVATLYDRWKPKFLEMCDLQSRLYEVGKAGLKSKAKEKEAGKMALRILDLRDEVISIYNERDHYLVLGQLPEKPAAIEECLDPALWPVKFQNAQRYVREYRKKLDSLSAEDSKYLQVLQKLNQWKDEVEHYKKLLKKD